jgi:acetyl esterase/lipase
MQIIKLWDGFELNDAGDKEATLTPFTLAVGEKSPAVLVIPGGGYGVCAQHEGAPVAQWLNSIGMSAFVLDYRVAPSKHPAPYHDARRAIQYIRYHAKEFNIDAEKIAVIGFSAGGHLAATLSNLYDIKNEFVNDEIEKVSARPDLSMLCYPVISSGEFAHTGSFDHLTGDDTKWRTELSMEYAVHADTPKTFIWHTVEDETVKVQNSYLYAGALAKQGIPHEVHVYPYGGHGLGLCSDSDDRSISHVEQWRSSCQRWLTQEGF